MSNAEIQVRASASNAEAIHYRDRLKGMPVTIENLPLAAEILAGIKARHTALTDELRKITKPMRDAEKAARDLFRPALLALAEAEAHLKSQIAIVRNAQLVANANAMRAAQTKLEAGDARGAALAATTIESTALPAGLSMREAWKYVIVDEALVPRELCSPDPSKIRAFLAQWGDTHPVPGIAITSETIVSSRSAPLPATS